MHSCTPPDRTGYVKQVDSISNALENVVSSYEKINLEELESTLDTVEKQIDFIKENFKGEMKKDMAIELGEYEEIEEFIPELGEREENISNGLTVSREQLSLLKKALTENATHDAVGNEINDEYIKKQIQQEKTINAALIREIEFIIQSSTSVTKTFERHYPQTKFWCDSIAASSK
jgi:hypothetical protein